MNMKLVKQSCVLLLVSYYCEIRGKQDRSALRHGVAVRRPSVRRIAAEENINSNYMAAEWSVRSTKMIRSRFLQNTGNGTGCVEDGNEVAVEEEEKCIRELLTEKLLSPRPLFSQKFIEWHSVPELSIYSVFTAEQPYSLSPGTCRLVKECPVSYLSSDRLRTRDMSRGEKSFVKV